MFKAACRGCHSSRGSAGSVQFDSLATFQSPAYGYGNHAADSSLQMPHAQRTWGIFWGSRSAVVLGKEGVVLPYSVRSALGDPRQFDRGL